MTMLKVRTGISGCCFCHFCMFLHIGNQRTTFQKCNFLTIVFKNLIQMGVPRESRARFIGSSLFSRFFSKRRFRLGFDNQPLCAQESPMRVVGGKSGFWCARKRAGAPKWNRLQPCAITKSCLLLPYMHKTEVSAFSLKINRETYLCGKTQKLGLALK